MGTHFPAELVESVLEYALAAEGLDAQPGIDEMNRPQLLMSTIGTALIRQGLAD